MNKLLEAALKYAQLGWRIIPLHGVDENGCCLCNEGCVGKVVGKKPHIKDWRNKATIEESVIRNWWRKWSGANIGILTGDSLLVLDVDPRNGGDKSLAELELKYGLLKTAQVRTGGGGFHYYYRKSPLLPIKGGTGRLGPGLDVKAEGGFVVAPPSRHACGEHYSWATTTLLPLPPWFVEEVTAAIATTTDLPHNIPEGERHMTLLSYAGRLRQAGLMEEEIEEKLYKLNERCIPPCSLQEISDIVNSIMNYNVADYTFDGFGNANRFRDDHKDYVRRCIDKGEWYIWDSARWKCAQDDELKALAIATMERMRNTASLAGPLEDKLRKWASTCRSEKRIRELLYLVGAESSLQTTSKIFDKDPILLNCQNGVVDFSSQTLRGHNREDYFTKCTGIAFNKDARSERWERFLNEACQDRKEQIAYMQLAAGYSLTGRTDEEKMFFIVGPAGTGKTTFIEAIRSIMGDYCIASNPHEFLTSTRGHTGPSPGVAKLASVRLVISSEMPHNAHLSEWVVKTLTGGDVITARHLYKEEFDFLPKFKLWLTMNDLPKFNYQDSGIQRRVIVIPFNNIPAKPDPELKRAFRWGRTEQEAVLAWAVKGAFRWVSGERLSEPECIIETTHSYRDAQNPLHSWLDDCAVCTKEAWLSSAALKESLQFWAASQALKLADFGLASDQALAQALRALGLEKKVRRDSITKTMANGWLGVRLRAEKEKF